MINAILDKAEQLARGKIGYREGPRNNETIFGAWFGMNFVSWCAIFLSWLSFNSGLTYLGKPWRFASTIAARDHAKRNGRWTTTPTVGTFAMMAHTATTGHVGFVIALIRKAGVLYVITIEGNTNDQGAREGNGVWLRARAASSWDGYIVLDQTNVQDPTNPTHEDEDEMKQRFYKIRDEADPSKQHPTKGDAIWTTADGVEAKFVNEAAWVHFRNLGWWDETKLELIPESAHNWLVSDATATTVAGLSDQIKAALASDADGGTGQITAETIDRIASAILDAQAARLKE